MDERFLKAFSELVREQVVHKNKIEIEGLGAFRREHRNQFHKQFKDGRVVMMPPKDIITFDPENDIGV